MPDTTLAPIRHPSDGHAARLYLKNFADLYERLSPKGLVPPQCVDLEEALLGAAMIDKASAARMIEILGPRTVEDSPFYRDAHTAIYRAMLALDAQSEPIDLLTVKNRLVLDGKLEEIGGPAYLVELTSKVVTTVNTESYARIVLEKYIGRELIRICEEIKLRAFEGELDTFALLDDADKFLGHLAETRMRRSGRFTSVFDSGLESIKMLDSIEQGREPGIPFGLKELDEMTTGSHPGQLIVLAARTGHGKSTLASHFALAASGSMDSKISTAFISLEMDARSLALRMQCCLAGVSMGKARRGHLNQGEWDRINEAQKKLKDMGIHIFDQRGVNIGQIRSALRRLANRLANTKQPLGRVILDYIALPKRPRKESKGEEIGQLAVQLRDLSKELGTDMNILSQITRDAAKRKNPRPVLSDLAESGDLEEHAEVVLLLYRPEVHAIMTDEAYLTRFGSVETSGVAEIIVAKQRDGETGTAYAKFIGNQSRFEDLIVFPKEEPVKEEVLF